MIKDEEYYMGLALKEAEKAGLMDEVPVGAVIVRNGTVIARAHNLREKNKQAYAHAEFLAIQKASRKLGTWCLDDCDLYVTLEPCPMCAGAISLARIHTLYYGAADPKAGVIESVMTLRDVKHVGVYPREIHAGLLREKCSTILTEFFREKRKKPKRNRADFKTEDPVK